MLDGKDMRKLPTVGYKQTKPATDGRKGGA